MNNNTEVVFDNIEQRILKEIKDAHYAIFVSVAWFTNKRLFQALLEKAKENCYISIIIQLDDINSQCEIDYNQIQVGRSECFMISKDEELLHDKFCVIDFKKVITGSYNWTYKASHNSENVVIISDPIIATQYITRFEQQKSKYNDINIKSKPQPQILLNKSTSLSVPSQSTTTNSSTPIFSNSIRKCYHCLNELNHNDAFCQHCGRQQKDFDRKITRVRKCKKCGHEQKEPLLDISKTHHCTNCGNNLFVEKGLPVYELLDSCPICKRIQNVGGDYCPSCGLKRIVSSDLALRHRNYDTNPLDARYEYRTFKDYQLCPKCHIPNYFEEKYCRNCGENLAFHAEDIKRYGWIDLGLSVLWSTETMEGFYPWLHSEMVKRAYLNDEFINDGKDTASVKWGNKWRIPTKEEFEELVKRCEWGKIVIPNSNKNALKVIGPNGNHIILPITGCYNILQNEEEYNYNSCYFWTSTKEHGDWAFNFGYLGYNIDKLELQSDALDTIIERRKKDQQRRNELWLNTPINKEFFQEFAISTHPIKCAFKIRPVADKKWQGKL